MSSGRRSQRLAITAVENAKQEPIKGELKPDTPEPAATISTFTGKEAPQKRKHVEIGGVSEESDAEAPPSKSQQTYKKDDTHWILDGNILFQIGNTRFKLHRSRLTSESKWFQTLVEQRSGHISETPFEYQDEIDKVLNTTETVNGLDLHYLDLDSAPTAEEFAALLTAMQSGIDYVYSPPDFDTMTSIYEASHFFDVGRYQKFCTTYFVDEFPDDWKSMGPEPSPHAADGVRIGSRFALKSILRHSFYDLARSPPLPCPILEIDRLAPGQAADLGKLRNTELIYLLNLQKQLSLAWDSVRSITENLNLCKGTTCKNHHSCKGFFKNTKAKYPFDPILGIKALLERDFITKNNYCEDADTEVRRRLALEQELIWTNMKTWLDIID
ncbi:hypothetical protein GALMADRAFT_259359 [Galerina marginata CBS 339.88]|uniref:BTB domain-containing protein n=1 Tax=Galerina marginata (strain CBS 339.88) TaxID=685588 RepID=A0A067SFL5_GALM3|nr:hypothetical protein GALMADRAFT_259359 [Galerina marginata CBS 339.88]